MKRNVLARLLQHIDTSGGPDACWPWSGYFSGDYPSIYVGRARKATALMLEIATSEDARDRLACHTCDNPPCCNPAHLYWGSNLTNAADRDRRGRHARLSGEAHGMAVLTADQVSAIRARYVPRRKGCTLADLAAEYGVHLSTIHLVVRNKKWRI